MIFYHCEYPDGTEATFESLSLALGVSLSLAQSEVWVSSNGVTSLYLLAPGTPPRYDLVYSDDRSTFLHNMTCPVVHHPVRNSE